MGTFDNIAKGSSTSSFWMDPSYFRGGSSLSDKERSSADLLKLAGVRRSIANFVKIVTGKNIPVQFKTGGSYTDGKRVVISADLSKFDSVCGTALHEGSHILLSNFDLLRDLSSDPEKHLGSKFIKQMVKKYGKSEQEVKKYFAGMAKQMCNYVEDRRIDNYIYTTAPGYQGYYDALYDEHWNSKEIDKGIKSDLYREENWESYGFRVINLTNAERDLDALKGLNEIWKEINLADIARIKSSKQALEVAVNVVQIIEKYTDAVWPPDQQPENGEGEKGEGDGEEGDGQDGDSGEKAEGENSEGKPGENKDTDEGGKVDGDTKNTPPSETPNANPELSDAEVEKLMDDIQKQKDFLDGKLEQKELSDEQGRMLKAMEEAGTEQKEVCKNSPMMKNGSGFSSCSVIVVKNMTKQLIDSNPFGIHYRAPYNEETVKMGMALGRQLGKKLQIRNESQSLKTTRLRNGKIDERLIHSLGFGAEQVFEKTFVDQFNPVSLHISIDASGSMDGEKWVKTQTAVVAIAKAASMVSNLDVVISYRHTANTGRTNKPLVLIAYDSRKDDISKVKALFPYLRATGGTPESLCFEAIQDLMVEGGVNQDSYFINFSDGEPYFGSGEIQYYGQSAIRHTKQMMDSFRRRGIKILSYFISSYHTDSDEFKQMYGKEASFVEVTKVLPLTKTLNKLFTTK